MKDEFYFKKGRIGICLSYVVESSSQRRTFTVFDPFKV